VANEKLGDPLETISSMLLAEELELDVVLAYDNSSSIPERAAILRRLKESAVVSNGSLRIVELGFRAEEAALCNLGLLEARADIVALARAGAAIDPTFLVDAVRALDVEPDYDFVLPQLMFEKGGSDASRMHTDSMRIGEALNTGLATNLFGAFELVARRSVVREIGFDEDLDRYADWDFHMRACIQGCRYITSNRIEVRIDSGVGVGQQDFRSHFDNVLAKHGAAFASAKIPLVSAVDASRSTNNTSGHTTGADDTTGRLIFAKRPLEYYLHETKPWWEIAYKHPTKPLRWLMLREMQMKGARAK
jgi:hypothetical protein